MITNHCLSSLRHGLCFLIFLSSCAQSVGFPSEIANANNCSEIPGFYDAPGGIDAPFLYGYLTEYSGHQSVIFWCKSNALSDKAVYKLIGYVKAKPHSSCTGVIYQTDNYPGGLTLSKAQNLKTVGYRSVSGYSDISPPAIFNGNIINSFYDGHGNTFFCENNNWFVANWD